MPLSSEMITVLVRDNGEVRLGTLADGEDMVLEDSPNANLTKSEVLSRHRDGLHRYRTQKEVSATPSWYLCIDGRSPHFGNCARI